MGTDRPGCTGLPELLFTIERDVHDGIFVTIRGGPTLMLLGPVTAVDLSPNMVLPFIKDRLEEYVSQGAIPEDIARRIHETLSEEHP